MLGLVCFVVCWLTIVANAMDEPTEYILDFPTINNPLNVSIITPIEKNYFIIIGDWGAESDVDKPVQKGVAKKMKSLYDKRKSEGYNLLFVATVGDNFYYSGQNCDYYKDRWTDIYGEMATDYPWLACFGNHDWGDKDPNAICAWGATDIKYIDASTGIPYAANQIDETKKGCNPSNYYLPDFGYYYTLNELSLELLFLEESVTICPEDMGGQKYKSCDDSAKIGCQYLGKMANASENMLINRAKVSNNSNFVILQHYPSKGMELLNLFRDNRPSNTRNNNDTVWSAYGHAHKQECKQYSKNAYGKNDDSDAPCESILTGGGGGCCAEATRRGFFVIDFDTNGKMVQPYKVDDSTISCDWPCLDLNEYKSLFTKEQWQKGIFEHCCYAYYDEEKCKHLDLRQCPTIPNQKH